LLDGQILRHCFAIHIELTGLLHQIGRVFACKYVGVQAKAGLRIRLAQVSKALLVNGLFESVNWSDCLVK
jgi:hypothetical protein